MASSSSSSSSSAEKQEDFLLELFDMYWFHHTVFVGRALTPEQPIAALLETERFDESHDQLIKKSELSRVKTLNVRSMSDRFVEVELGQTDSESAASPKSVLVHSKLQSALPGKEVEKVSEGEKGLIGRRHARKISRKKKKWNSRTRSMSELEFEELKGFMDLGFVFFEQDKDSVDLVSIIPGLQRLGKRQGLEVEEGGGGAAKIVGSVSIQRPYLSEAWEIPDGGKKVDPLVNWKVTDLGNEMAVKDQLRFWAHAVASSVG
ncbi:hypothetical protein SAY87_008130 [Trapa incisa]|uniref:Uncharacterized protein n=1 Tax=Trapa incisa TaxID=236973 RepID=A0AAN7QGD8_9MYRT|nr:hypothetical protein SAY87_008130 [Trapa incisa]